MIVRVILLAILFTTGGYANATERFFLNFELTLGEKKVEWGAIHVSMRAHTWSKGLQTSYLKLSCHRHESGKTEKLYSIEDHFSGLRITHQLTEKNIVLTVVRKSVQPRLIEIRALSKDKCKDLSPIVTTTTETYSFPVTDGVDESNPFGENMKFRVILQAL